MFFRPQVEQLEGRETLSTGIAPASLVMQWRPEMADPAAEVASRMVAPFDIRIEGSLPSPEVLEYFWTCGAQNLLDFDPLTGVVR